MRGRRRKRKWNRMKMTCLFCKVIRRILIFVCKQSLYLRAYQTHTQWRWISLESWVIIIIVFIIWEDFSMSFARWMRTFLLLRLLFPPKKKKIRNSAIRFSAFSGLSDCENWKGEWWVVCSPRMRKKFVNSEFFLLPKVFRIFLKWLRLRREYERSEGNFMWHIEDEKLRFNFLFFLPPSSCAACRLSSLGICFFLHIFQRMAKNRGNSLARFARHRIKELRCFSGIDSNVVDMKVKYSRVWCSRISEEISFINWEYKHTQTMMQKRER